MGKTRDLFQIIRDTTGTLHAKMGTIKERNSRITEAEEIKKRWQEHTEELYEKDLNDPDNHDCEHSLKARYPGVQSQVSLKSISINKASRGDGIPDELFQILKDDAILKCCTQYASKFEKLISGHRTGKGQFLTQSPKKAMPKNFQATAQLHSSHTLAK